MLTPQAFSALPIEERRERLADAARGLGPHDKPLAVRLGAALVVPTRTVYDWLKRPDLIPFSALAYLEASAEVRQREEVVIAMEDAVLALSKARSAAVRARDAALAS